MRHVLVLIALSLPLPTLAGPPGLAGHEGNRLEHLAEKLELDAEQREAVQEILAATHDEAKVLRKGMKADVETLRAALEEGDRKALKSAVDAVEDRRADIQALHEATREQVTDVLTLEQRGRAILTEVGRHHDRRPGEIAPGL